MSGGGRSFPLAQKVMEHGSATVGYEDYRGVLEMALAVLPPKLPGHLAGGSRLRTWRVDSLVTIAELVLGPSG